MFKTLISLAAFATLAATTIAPAQAFRMLNGSGENGSFQNGGNGNGAASGSSTLAVESVELPAAKR